MRPTYKTQLLRDPGMLVMHAARTAHKDQARRIIQAAWYRNALIDTNNFIGNCPALQERPEITRSLTGDMAENTNGSHLFPRPLPARVANAD